MAIHAEILDRGGQVVAYSAQSQRQVDKLRTELRLDFLHCLSDPEHKLRNVLKEDGILDVYVTNKDKRYPHGRLEPSLLIFSHNQEVMFRWRIVPSLSNLGGASNRPLVSRVFEVIKLKLDGQIPVDEGTTLEDIANQLKMKIGVIGAFSSRVMIQHFKYKMGGLWRSLSKKRNKK